MNYIIKSVIGTLIIFWMIGFGIVLNHRGHTLLGYFIALSGGTVIYFLCLSYFDKWNKEYVLKESKESKK